MCAAMRAREAPVRTIVYDSAVRPGRVGDQSPAHTSDCCDQLTIVSSSQQDKVVKSKGMKCSILLTG